jgi:hypothetical protein
LIYVAAARLLVFEGWSKVVCRNLQAEGKSSPGILTKAEIRPREI